MIPILYYHSLGKGVPTESFIAHLDALEGRNVVAVRDAVDGAGDIAVSFDDGLLDNFENGAPLLIERGMRATFYIILDQIGRPGRMDAYQLRELVECGMEIGGHSATHPRLNRVNDVEAEVAKDRLEQIVGSSVTTFAYPYGCFSARVVRAVRDAGYRAACTTVPGYYAPSPFLLPRFIASGPDWLEEVIAGRLTRALWKAAQWKLSRHLP